MGIAIYARWKGQSDAERMTQATYLFTTTDGGKGYLQESYHGEPYATRHLCPEAFEDDGAHIPSAVLKERLPRALALTEERERALYQTGDRELEEVKQSFRDFVALCEAKEKETGEPVFIIASW